MNYKWASPNDTEQYFKWNPVHPDKIRIFDGLTVSQFGLGNYLGANDDTTDQLYKKTLVEAAMSGINFFDTAINTRAMRSEKVLAQVIQECQAKGAFRQQFVISTKGGYLPHEGNYFEEYVRKTYLDTGILEAKDIVAESHAMTPAFLESQIHMSLKNLQIDCIDLYFLHNPETQLLEVSEEEFYNRLTLAFALFEEKVSEKKIKRYGIATWNGFRAKKRGLDLEKVLASAKDAGGENHHFRAIQVPYNLVMMEALKQDFFKRASDHNLYSMISAPLMQGKIFNLAQRVYDELPQGSAKVNQALEFIFSTPNIITAFCSIKTFEHFQQCKSVLQEPNWSQEVWEKACETLGFAPIKN